MHDPTPIPEGIPLPPTGASDRRSALGWLALILGGLATAALGIPLVGYLLGPLFQRKPDQWVDAGAVSDFPLNQTREIIFSNPDRQPLDGATGGATAYVRYLGHDSQEGHRFDVFAVFCAHLGCPVTWFEQSGLFMCPCHGGVYYANGDRASGPPPQGLYRYEYKVEDGRLRIKAGHLPTLQNQYRGNSRTASLRRATSPKREPGNPPIAENRA
jgi:Rieske Fe-S protein